MANKSHLYEYHMRHGKITDFAGFDMPLWYTSIIDEHMAVRNAAGLFDVSHMGRVEIEGEGASDYLEYILPSSVKTVENGRAFYSVMCKEDGGILDDVVTDKLSPSSYIMVVNAANREKDLEWLNKKSHEFNIKISDQSNTSSLVALQGPRSKEILQKLCDIDLSKLKRFRFLECKVNGDDCLVSRTGYTGEDGYEILLRNSPLDNPTHTVNLWEKLLDYGRGFGLLPCGLGARDSLRLEAGMCLYGQDLDETTTPIEGSLDTLVDIGKTPNFVGRNVIQEQLKNGVSRKRVAFSMLESGIPRHGFDVTYGGKKVGAVTSGSFSPILKKGIGMAYVPPELGEIGSRIWIRIRESDKLAEVVKTPFYDTNHFGSRRKAV